MAFKPFELHSEFYFSEESKMMNRRDDEIRRLDKEKRRILETMDAIVQHTHSIVAFYGCFNSIRST